MMKVSVLTLAIGILHIIEGNISYRFNTRLLYNSIKLPQMAQMPVSNLYTAFFRYLRKMFKIPILFAFRKDSMGTFNINMLNTFISIILVFAWHAHDILKERRAEVLYKERQAKNVVEICDIDSISISSQQMTSLCMLSVSMTFPTCQKYTSLMR